jgi:hypothetical protein
VASIRGLNEPFWWGGPWVEAVDRDAIDVRENRSLGYGQAALAPLELREPALRYACSRRHLSLRQAGSLPGIPQESTDHGMDSNCCGLLGIQFASHGRRIAATPFAYGIARGTRRKAGSCGPRRPPKARTTLLIERLIGCRPRLGSVLHRSLVCDPGGIRARLPDIVARSLGGSGRVHSCRITDLNVLAGSIALLS